MQNYAKIEQYIDQNSLAVLGTTDDDGSPYGAVVNVCTIDDHPAVYFITKNGTRKYKNLLARPQVSLTIYNPSDSSTLQAKGQASQVQDAVTLDKITTRITRIHALATEWLPPVSKIRAGEYAMVAVELIEARLANYKGKQIGDSDIFTEI